MIFDAGLRDTGQPFDKLRDPSRVSCLAVSRLKLNLLIYCLCFLVQSYTKNLQDEINRLEKSAFLSLLNITRHIDKSAQ